MKKRRSLRLIILICLGSMTEVTSKLFNKIAHNQRPLQAPFQTTRSRRTLCFSLCTHNTKCYSFLIDQSDPNALQCLLYNDTINYSELEEQDNSKQSVLYSQLMRDCLDWYNVGARNTGIYTIVISGGFSKRVRCNMDIDSGGWLVFQYRHNGEIDFFRNWQEYKQGFGSLDKEFWLGNDWLYYFTSSYDQELYIQGERFSGDINFSKYSEFKIDSEDQKYRLHVSGLTGTRTVYDGALFSSPDQDNDDWTGGDCAKFKSRGGFWYTACGKFFPNSLY